MGHEKKGYGEESATERMRSSDLPGQSSHEHIALHQSRQILLCFVLRQVVEPGSSTERRNQSSGHATRSSDQTELQSA